MQILELLKQHWDERVLSTLLITRDTGVVAETCVEGAVFYADRVVEPSKVGEIF